MSEFEDRRETADPAELIADPDERARREAENGILQFEAALAVIGHHAGSSGAPFHLTPDIIRELHRVGLNGIHAEAGTFRTRPVTIGSSRHVPPRSAEIPGLVAGLCDHLTGYWYGYDAAEIAAYALWRVNWIHPFADGNGRLARTVSYLVLSAKLGYVLPGSPTIPEQIADSTDDYYRLLEEADDSWKRGFVAVSGLASMLESMLERQLRSAMRPAPS